MIKCIIPDGEKRTATSAPKLVAISMGWIARAKSMSEAAREIMKTSVELILLGLSIITVTTSRLEKKLIRTEIIVTI